MRYQLKQIYCRPWTLSGLSLKLIESHYENNYGGALRRLNAITEQLESLDFAKTPGYVINGLKREELVALNSTLLHELYFASMGGDGRVTSAMSEALARDFGSVQRWRTEFSAMGYALGGGSGWVLLSWMPRDGRLINQYASEHSQAIAGGIPLLALDMYEHAYHIDFGANATAYVDTFLRNVDWQAVEGRLRGREQGGAAAAAGAGGVRRPAGRRRRGGEGDAGGRQAAAAHRHAAEALRLAPAGHRRGRHLARPRARRRVDGRALQGEAGGGVLRLRLSRRLPHRDRVARCGLRRPLHDGRPLRLEGRRRAGQDEHMSAERKSHQERQRRRQM